MFFLEKINKNNYGHNLLKTKYLSLWCWKPIEQIYNKSTLYILYILENSHAFLCMAIFLINI